MKTYKIKFKKDSYSPLPNRWYLIKYVPNSIREKLFGIKKYTIIGETYTLGMVFKWIESKSPDIDTSEFSLTHPVN